MVQPTAVSCTQVPPAPMPTMEHVVGMRGAHTRHRRAHEWQMGAGDSAHGEMDILVQGVFTYYRML